MSKTNTSWVSPHFFFFFFVWLGPLKTLNIYYCYLQKLAAYDEDAYLSVSALLGMKTCNGRIGATGMCLGGHLAYRCAFDNRVAAAVCYFATDIHSHSLGQGKNDDSLDRAGDIRSELVMVRFFFISFFSPLPSSLWNHKMRSKRERKKKEEKKKRRLMRTHFVYRSLAKKTTTFPQKEGTWYVKPSMKRAFYSVSTKSRMHSVSNCPLIYRQLSKSANQTSGYCI